MAPPSVYDKIGCITKELIKDGTINKHHERHLKERLSFLCKDSPRAPPSNGHRYSRKEITAFSKLKTARKVYMRVLQDNAPLFLPLLLAVAPGSWHKVKDKELAKLTEQRNIHLKASAKEYLEKISQNEGFATSDNFRRILEALFPKGFYLEPHQMCADAADFRKCLIMRPSPLRRKVQQRALMRPPPLRRKVQQRALMRPPPLRRKVQQRALMCSLQRKVRKRDIMPIMLRTWKQLLVFVAMMHLMLSVKDTQRNLNKETPR
ncbi:hypothetical protein LZ32DRAFT_109531 [Colletotrichum eremochloae]|nr:hypothetical protein LZ32DRAFT_109531 [Colletotrichum eremochloae]